MYAWDDGKVLLHGVDLANDCPYGRSGSRLWVRETFQFVCANSDGQRRTFSSRVPFTQHDFRWIEYAATPKDDEPPTWKPSIHMPRWASRITLEIVRVRVDRLQDLMEADANAEGFPSRADFAGLWDKLHDPRCGWLKNPWVWVIEFEKP